MVRRLFAQCLINTSTNSVDTHSLKRAARKLLKQYNFDLQEFPNLATQEKISFLKTLFVRKYLENKNGGDDGDDESWKAHIKVSFMNNKVGSSSSLSCTMADLFW
jgi:predicted helicase